MATSTPSAPVAGAERRRRHLTLVARSQRWQSFLCNLAQGTEPGATTAAARPGSSVAALSQCMAYREVLDRGRDRVGRVADEEDAELIVAADGEVRRATAVDDCAVAEDQRQFVGKRDRMMSKPMGKCDRRAGMGVTPRSRLGWLVISASIFTSHRPLPPGISGISWPMETTISQLGGALASSPNSALIFRALIVVEWSPLVIAADAAWFLMIA